MNDEFDPGVVARQAEEILKLKLALKQEQQQKERFFIYRLEEEIKSAEWESKLHSANSLLASNRASAKRRILNDFRNKIAKAEKKEAQKDESSK